MVWGFCVYFVYMIPLETDVLRKHRFQKTDNNLFGDYILCLPPYDLNFRYFEIKPLVNRT